MIPSLLLSITLILTIAGFFSQFGWWFDLAAHFRIQYFILQLICIILFFFFKRWKWLTITLLGAIINLTLIAPFYLPSVNRQAAYSKSHSEITILLINLNSSNNEYGKVREYIKKINPDILALEEINENWLAALKGTLDAFSYQKDLPRGDNFGIGLYSKIATESMSIVYFGPVEVPSVLATYTINHKPLTVLFTHPVPPASLKYYHWRNEQLEDIASKRAYLGDNLILVGDLNTTSWSQHFSNFIKTMNLADTRRGFGVQATWPVMFPIMGIAIDHVLVGKTIRVLDRKVGPNIGSDHYPVYVKLGIH